MTINSYLAHGHSFHLYVNGKVKNVPQGTVVEDVRSIFSDNAVFKDEFKGFVNLSNLFRYKLLFSKGGWWVDMDTVCLKKFDFDSNFVFSTEKSLGRIHINTTFIKSINNMPYLYECIEFIKKRGINHIHWGELGVNLFSRMIFRSNLHYHALPPNVFCPVSVNDFDIILSPSNYVPSNETYAIHWWNEIWKRKNLDKNGIYSKDCLYEKMKKLYY